MNILSRRNDVDTVVALIEIVQRDALRIKSWKTAILMSERGGSLLNDGLCDANARLIHGVLKAVPYVWIIDAELMELNIFLAHGYSITISPTIPLGILMI